VLLIIMGTGAAAAAIGATAYYELTRTKSSDIEAMIDEQLRTGAPAEKIFAVLDAEGIEHGAVEPFPGGDQDLLYAGVTKDTPIISATVRNEGHTLEYVDLQITFILDETGALKDTVIYEIRHHPAWIEKRLPK
jgi:hypothetical protein